MSTSNMAHWQWGCQAHLASRIVLCVHGLTRQGRDFDAIAQALVKADATLCVVCPDLVGRGQSDWLTTDNDSKHNNPYQMPLYIQHLVELVMQLTIATPTTEIDWIGTSMGGLLGLACAPILMKNGIHLRRLVLNDVGPTLEFAAMQRIAQLPPHPIYPYDALILEPLKQMTPHQAHLASDFWWSCFDGLHMQLPILLLRGENSDALTPKTMYEMQIRHLNLKCTTIPNVGHAPTLTTDFELATVLDFLN